MEKKDRSRYREIIERYCNIIDANAAIIMTDGEDGVTYECLSCASCEKRFGGCMNEKYGRKSCSE